MDKFLKTFLAVIQYVFKQVFSSVTDAQWDIDPYKIGGWAAYVLAGFGGVFIFSEVSKLDVGKLGILAGLVGSAITLGGFLFSQARQADQHQTTQSTQIASSTSANSSTTVGMGK